MMDYQPCELSWLKSNLHREAKGFPMQIPALTFQAVNRRLEACRHLNFGV
jgi:hypothetical protein